MQKLCIQPVTWFPCTTGESWAHKAKCIRTPSAWTLFTPQSTESTDHRRSSALIWALMHFEVIEIHSFVRKVLSRVSNHSEILRLEHVNVCLRRQKCWIERVSIPNHHSPGSATATPSIIVLWLSTAVQPYHCLLWTASSWNAISLSNELAVSGQRTSSW